MRDPDKTGWSEAKKEALRLARETGEDHRIIERSPTKYRPEPHAFLVIPATDLPEYKGKITEDYAYSVKPFVAFATNVEGQSNLAPTDADGRVLQ